MRAPILSLLAAAALAAGCAVLPAPAAAPGAVRPATSRVEVRVAPIARGLMVVQPEIEVSDVAYISLVLYQLTGQCVGDKCGQVGVAGRIGGDFPPRYFDPIAAADLGTPIVVTDLYPGGEYRFEASAWSGLPNDSEDLTDRSSSDAYSVEFTVGNDGVAKVYIPVKLKKLPFSGTAKMGDADDPPLTIVEAPSPGVMTPAPSPYIDQVQP